MRLVQGNLISRNCRHCSIISYKLDRILRLKLLHTKLTYNYAGLVIGQYRGFIYAHNAYNCARRSRQTTLKDDERLPKLHKEPNFDDCDASWSCFFCVYLRTSCILYQGCCSRGQRRVIFKISLGLVFRIRVSVQDQCQGQFPFSTNPL